MSRTLINFAAMHLLVVTAMFSFPVTRGHDFTRSITCSLVWSGIVVIAWTLMIWRGRPTAQLWFAFFASAAAIVCAALGWLDVTPNPMTAPKTMFAAIFAGGLGSGLAWDRPWPQ